MSQTPDERETLEPRAGGAPDFEAAYVRWQDLLKRVGAAGGAVAALIMWGMGVANEGSLRRPGVGDMVVLLVGACVSAVVGAVVGVRIAGLLARAKRDAFHHAWRMDHPADPSKSGDE